MNISFKGKTVGITGSAGGIGGSLADAYASEGANLIICDISAERLEKKKKALEEKGAEVLAQVCDVSNPESVKSLIDAAVARFGGIDVWINNAGIGPMKDFVDVPLETWHKIFAVNLDSVFITCQVLFPYMKDRGGVILNTASWTALMPRAGLAAYGSSKAAISNLTQTLAAEFAPYNIRVNAYAPGFITTELTDGYLSDPASRGFWECMAVQRPGKPADLVGPVLFMTSEMSAFITGITLDVSGGKFIVQNASYPWQKREELEEEKES